MSVLPLILEKAEVRRQGRTILGPVSVEIAAGAPLVLLGPNGAGKTTFLRVSHGIERLSGGRVHWAADRARADLAQSYVFQQPILLRRTVIDNVAYPLRVRGEGRGAARAVAERALEGVGLGNAGGRLARVLSGGERQKMALARALVTQPEVLFLDEPTASLDGRSTREIEAILTRASASGTKLVMATHDLGQARRLAGDILFLLNGHVHEAGPAPTFFEGPTTSEARAFLKGDIVE